MAIVSTVLVAASAFLLARVLFDVTAAPFDMLVPERRLTQAKSELGSNWVAAASLTWSVGLVVIVFAGWWMAIVPIALLLAVIWLLTPGWILAWKIHRRRLLLRDQLASCTQSLANSARAGQSLAQGLKGVSQESPEPLAGELRQLMAEYDLGRPLPDALLDAKQRLQLDSFSMFASTIVVSLQQGGRVTEALEKISRSLRENQRIERKLDAETAGGWRVVLILTLFPFLFLLGFYVVHPEGTMLMFQSWIGQFLVVVMLLLIVSSVYWSRKILRIEL